MIEKVDPKIKDGRRNNGGRRQSAGRKPGTPNRLTKDLRKPQRSQPEPRIAYSDDLAAKICGHIADGLSLKEVCMLDGMPSRATAYKWLAMHSSFADMYARAREERADLIADEIVTIADNDPDPNRARVRIDARKWWAAKVNPKKYGDKLVTENTTATYTISDKPMTEEEWRAAYCGTDAPRSGGVH
jgi:hypothetical protein